MNVGEEFPTAQIIKDIDLWPSQQKVLQISSPLASTLRNGHGNQIVVPVPYVTLHNHKHVLPDGFTPSNRVRLGDKLGQIGYTVSAFGGYGFVIHPLNWTDSGALSALLTETAKSEVLCRFQELEADGRTEYIPFNHDYGFHLIPTYINKGLPNQNLVVVEKLDESGKMRILDVIWMTQFQVELFENVADQGFYIDSEMDQFAKLQEAVTSLNLILGSCSTTSHELIFAPVEPAGYALTQMVEQDSSAFRFGDYRRRENHILKWLNDFHPLGNAFSFFQEGDNVGMTEETKFIEKYRIVIGDSIKGSPVTNGLYVYIVDFKRATESVRLPFRFDSKTPMAVCMEGRSNTIRNTRLLFEVTPKVAQLLRSSLIDTEKLYIESLDEKQKAQAYKGMHELRNKMKLRGLNLKTNGKSLSLPIPLELFPDHIAIRMVE